MDNERVIYLYTRIKSKEATAAEEQEFDSLLSNATSQEVLKGFWDEQWNAVLAEDQLKIQIENEEQILADILVNKRKETSAINLWPRIIGVAAAVAAIVFGIWFFNGRTEILRGALDDKSVAYQNDIAPGKNAATIKIGDGEAITLSDKQTGVIIAANKLSYNDGTNINNPSLPARGISPQGGERIGSLTVSTPRGGTYQVTLPDGTKVWLNAASRLTYTMPLKERGGIRKVELSGEAYFEVFRNKNQPFVVTTKNLTTTVLGTHFNISAYDDEGSTKATLLEGSVRVISLDPLGRGGVAGEGPVILKPNQQAAVTGSSGIAVKEVDAADIIAWKNSYFRFTNEQIGPIMSKLARWYNIDVEYEGNMPEERFNAAISRNKNISQILKIMERTNAVHFKIEGRKVTVTR